MHNTSQIPVYTSLNQKGGVGKTKQNLLFAEYCAIHLGLRTLLIDLDLQANATRITVGMEPDPLSEGAQLPPRHPDYSVEMTDINERSTIADIFYGKNVLPFESWLTQQYSRSEGYMDVIAAHPTLIEEINISFNKVEGQLEKQVINRIHDFLTDNSINEYYDIVIIDLGPSRNPIMRSVLRAATHIGIPFCPESNDIQGINALVQIIMQENYARGKNHPPLELVGFLPSKIKKQTALHADLLDVMKKQHSEYLAPEQAWLSDLIAFAETDSSSFTPRSVFLMRNSVKAKQQAMQLCGFIANKVFQDRPDILNAALEHKEHADA